MILIDLEDESIDADLLNSLAVTMDDFQVHTHTHTNTHKQTLAFSKLYSISPSKNNASFP